MSVYRPRFESIAAFYEMRGGEWSGESDFGVHWTDGRDWPRHRVSVVEETGDVYAINSSTGEVELLGNVGHMDAYRHAENVLFGWSDPEITELDWARGRLALVGREA